ncbi:8-oxo-dGTP diphosphatase [Deinococcus peraridilitoris]|uniref:Oxidized purine nucleoside triphosphate hydrolase n=1 Tax=Deinococcus peraridilitoris (strain DSM 19664 / LMG 22246 / CIP 109416 / KR-200) TaxID=937777 RepID=K9ZWF5_DEIPD|nr:8-oxo-dGTP diphosphatase [Deinococcus peraridilitoris]AFZ65978.1 ADP-ribose pyrophosphatase [Deinococcus peraridilitoris DSM 19664]
MKRCAVLLPTDGKRVLLGLKKRGFGQGKIVELGGKIEPGESPDDTARRELHEESNLQALDTHAAGEVIFEFSARPDLNLHVFVFVTHRWEGVPCESDEIAPEWFETAALPYARMWADAPHWLPQVLRGEQVKYRFVFADDGETIAQITLLEEHAH